MATCGCFDSCGGESTAGTSFNDGENSGCPRWMRNRITGFWAMLLILAALLSFVLRGVFLPGQIMFSNDGPLGSLMAQCHRLPERFFGSWHDLNLIGYSEGSAPPGIAFGLPWI